MKGVQCYELFGGIALKIHTFSFFSFHIPLKNRLFFYRRVSTADLNLWIESVCLSSESKEFHIAGAAKQIERCPNVFVRC